MILAECGLQLMSRRVFSEKSCSCCRVRTSDSNGATTEDTGAAINSCQNVFRFKAYFKLGLKYHTNNIKGLLYLDELAGSVHQLALAFP